MALDQSAILCFTQANNQCTYYIYTFTLVLDMCASVCSFLDLTRLVSGGVFDCNIISGRNILLDVSGHYNNCSDGLLSVLVLCWFQIVGAGSLLETMLHW